MLDTILSIEDIPVSEVKITVPVSLQSRRREIKENKHNQ